MAKNRKEKEIKVKFSPIFLGVFRGWSAWEPLKTLGLSRRR